MDLHTAQQEMARDWISAYKKYVSPVPLPEKHGRGKAARLSEEESTARDLRPDTETTPETPGYRFQQRGLHRAGVGEPQERRHLAAGQPLLRQDQGRPLHERGRRARCRIPWQTQDSSCDV